MAKISLPKGRSSIGLSVEEAIERRRSERNYFPEAMSLSELSHLLHYSVGITEKSYKLRAIPSAGELYPIEVHPIVNRVNGLASGIYHYVVDDHSLHLVKEGDFRQELTEYALGQEMMGKANVVLVLTAVFERSQWKYRERASHYMLLEAGHIGQNVYLVATSMGLGVCAIGAYSDHEYNRLIGVDGRKESVIYLLSVGKIWRE